MNTAERISLLSKFSNHLDQKVHRCSRDVETIHRKSIEAFIQKETKLLDVNNLPQLDVLKEMKEQQSKIQSTITETHTSIATVMDSLRQIKNRKDNASKLLDIKDLSYKIKVESCEQPGEVCRVLQNYYSIKGKVKYCDKYIRQIETQITKIHEKFKAQFDRELKKTDSKDIKQISKVLDLIKSNLIKASQREKTHVGETQNIQDGAVSSKLSEFYIEMAKKELEQYEEELFNIPIIGNTSGSQVSYIFFDIAKNALKVIAVLIQKYQNNILNLEGERGLHRVIISVFGYTLNNLGLQILVRQKKYFQIDKIAISRNKLTLKTAQYKILKGYFKEFNAIWNQIQRFKLHVTEYLDEEYKFRTQFSKQLDDITNSQKFVDFNYEVILYFEAFFRHQLDKLLKKSPFVLSMWQLDEGFFKEVKAKDEYKNNTAGQDFIQQMITKFSQGIKKSFETLNILIISALVNFVNHNLISEDSFYAFNELFARFVQKLETDPKAIEGVSILLNTVSSYPKAIKSTFEELQIPEELPVERIKNQIQQLIYQTKQKTGQFILAAMDKLINSDLIQNKLLTQNYEEAGMLIKHLERDLYELYIFKLSRAHAEIILSQEFTSTYTHMDVLSLEKNVRKIINFYEEKGHSIRDNFRRILDYIQILLADSEKDLDILMKDFKGKYQERQLRNLWRLRVE